MSDSENVNKMIKSEILSEICSGRTCRECPLGNERDCRTVLKKDLVVAYRKLFFQVTEEELMSILSGE